MTDIGGFGRYQKSIKPTGVIYTHPISEAHESGARSNSFCLISDMCGQEAADRVRIVTTMWDETDETFAERAERAMKAGPWKSFLDAGARYARFHNTSESAWEIVLGLGDTKKALFIQDHCATQRTERMPTFRRIPSKIKFVSRQVNQSTVLSNKLIRFIRIRLVLRKPKLRHH